MNLATNDFVEIMCKVKLAWLVFHVGDRTDRTRWPWSTVRLEPFITRCDGHKQT